jgi:hypothetical protein
MFSLLESPSFSYGDSPRPPSGDARKLANAALTQSPAEGNPPLLAVSPRPNVSASSSKSPSSPSSLHHLHRQFIKVHILIMFKGLVNPGVIS